MYDRQTREHCPDDIVDMIEDEVQAETERLGTVEEQKKKHRNN